MFGRAGTEIPLLHHGRMGGCLWCAVAAAGGCVEILCWNTVFCVPMKPRSSMLAPGKKKPSKAYVWATAPHRLPTWKAAIYDFAPSRAGEHAQATFAGDWRGRAGL